MKNTDNTAANFNRAVSQVPEVLPKKMQKNQSKSYFFLKKKLKTNVNFSQMEEMRRNMVSHFLH